MRKIKIADGIHMLTMNVDEILFEGMWDIMNGVTLNSYIVREKDCNNRRRDRMGRCTGNSLQKPGGNWSRPSQHRLSDCQSHGTGPLRLDFKLQKNQG